MYNERTKRERDSARCFRAIILMCILFLAEFVLFYFAAYMPHSEMIHDSVPRAFYKSLSAVFIERAPLSRFT